MERLVQMGGAEIAWICVGFLGQSMFFFRLLIQWIVSERRGESVVPTVYWYFSIAGGLILLSYALWRRDPVFILGQSMGCVVYARNLILIRRARRRAREALSRS